MKKYPAISLHHRQLQDFGISLMPLSALSEKGTGIHRDDQYLFILQKKGKFVLEVDFSTMELDGAWLCFVAPGQTRQYKDQEDIKGWFLSIDTRAIPELYRDILEACQWIHQRVEVGKMDSIFDIPVILDKIEENNRVHNAAAKQALVESVIGMMVSRLTEFQDEDRISEPPLRITRQFKKLVREHYKKVKQVREYARFLIITPVYLNEAVKEISGQPASFWIQHQVLLEAKRLLLYTTMDVKQIAHELGYEDPVYFSRVFKKGTGMTAVEFRAKRQEEICQKQKI
ncbi:hypothetical protein IQ37_10065 [Chryseobacterium piperi]|uniref:HTH araC/xylS-type domain-containing protein n=1 Tax=Chryseobacterium piperi TaxID=558152 RepID=A0A086BIE6_9FLAO|nr:AraC family transcriptional regulator [Chryseobacterium piperi]ASW73027.1 AraC family transcriptional regulator [Chryseobacterium piperi]KFF28710.1 hypothetical protein IQ37_10065 [Chryseobacterium piperi]